MCTKMRMLWTILVLGSLLQCSYAEVTNSAQAEIVTGALPAPSTDSTTAGPTSSQLIISTVPSLHTTNSISTTQLPTKKDSTTAALTLTTNKDLFESVDSTTPQHTTGSHIIDPKTDTTAPEATTTKLPQKTGVPITDPESATTTTKAPENTEKTTNIASKELSTQEHTTTVPVPTTTYGQHLRNEGTTKLISSETSHTTTPVLPTSSAIITTVSPTTPALATTTKTATTTRTTTTMAATTTTTTAATTTTTAMMTIRTISSAPKQKMFNRTIAAISTGDKLERICAQLMGLINTTINCNMVGKEINGDYQFSSITLKVVDPLVEVNKSTDFEHSEKIHMTSIAIMASCGALALFLIAFAVYCSCHRLSYRKNQQHLTEELQTVENGYHDNPTLEVMEVHPEMQEKKMALNREFNDSWIVPFDNLAKDDIPEEEDTHL